MWTTEQSSLGRVVVPPSVPEGFAVFYTTSDFRGRLTDEIAADVLNVLRERHGISARLATCHQVHGAHTMRAPRVKDWEECGSCDALWSDEPGTALAIKVADCLPVTLIDPKHRVIANVHAGWRGVSQKIVDAALSEVIGTAGFEASSSSAYLGPSIRACCFEVGDEVVAELDRVYGGIEPFVDRSREKPHVDLAGIVTQTLRDRGVAHIHDSGICTRCEGSIFHSYRRDPNGGGRNLAIVAF
jgi:YfiH family protein